MVRVWDYGSEEREGEREKEKEREGLHIEDRAVLFWVLHFVCARAHSGATA
jgi:hypothetical protein